MKQENSKALVAPNSEEAVSIMEIGEFEHYTVTEHGIEFKPATPREVWLESTQKIANMHEGSGRMHFRTICLLADALNFGEEAFGEEYAQAIDDTRKWMQVSAKTIQNAMWIMRAVPQSLRRETLSLAHHEVVAALQDEEKDELLGKAESENLSVAALKKLVKERHPKTAKGKTRKAVIDLKSEEGLQHAAEKVLEWFTAYDESDEGKKHPFKGWTEARKQRWAMLSGLAKIARRLGLSR